MATTANYKMNIAIFWLPILGGGILWAIAISAWYGSDKLPAIWFAFAGTTCLLLTAAIQTHEYVSANLLQPVIALSPPKTASHLRWEPSVSIGPVLKAPRDQIMEGSSSSPRFQLINSGVPGSDASITWEAPAVDNNQILNSSPQLKKYVSGNISDAQFKLLIPSSSMTFTYQTSTKVTLPVPFLTRPIEIYLPFDVWSRGFLMVLAQLPDTAGNEVFEIPFKAVVSWNIPDKGKPQTFHVIARVKNTKRTTDSAIFDADVDFEIREFPFSQQ